MIKMKRAAKLVISGCWLACLAIDRSIRQLLRVWRPKLTILYYHSIPRAEVTAFDWQMSYLRKNCLVVRADHQGVLGETRPNVAVTFDDAFRSVREQALASLIRYEIPATIFVPTGYLGRAPGWQMEGNGSSDECVMSVDELQSMASDSIRFGSHTVDHPKLSQLSDSDVLQQLRKSRETLEAIVGYAIDTLAFPYGDFGSDTVRLCAQAGYSMVYSVAPERIDPEMPKILRGRTSVDPTDSRLEFALKARGAYSWMRYASALKAKARKLLTK